MKRHARAVSVVAVLLIAAEYGLPIFRVASSGISQLVDARGTVQASAPFPGEKATLAGPLRLGKAGLVPIDRWVAPQSAVLTGLLAVSLAVPVLWRPRLGPTWKKNPATAAVAL